MTVGVGMMGVFSVGGTVVDTGVLAGEQAEKRRVKRKKIDASFFDK
jgi:hypothetical protein